MGLYEFCRAPSSFQRLMGKTLQGRARTNVATFECLFVFVTFVSRFFATKHLLIFIMSKSCTHYM